MIDNIIIKRIWQDEEFFQVLVTCINQHISASTEIYLTDSIVDELHSQIATFLHLEKDTVSWQSGNRGNQSTPCIAFCFSMKDSGGHVLIEVYMELNDGGDLEKHNCCFYLNTELGLLQNFNKNIPLIKKKSVGNYISLKAPHSDEYM